jgi:hypothetical protein
MLGPAGCGKFAGGKSLGAAPILPREIYGLKTQFRRLLSPLVLAGGLPADKTGWWAIYPAEGIVGRQKTM